MILVVNPILGYVYVERFCQILGLLISPEFSTLHIPATLELPLRYKYLSILNRSIQICATALEHPCMLS
jgi:hypothetical protein